VLRHQRRLRIVTSGRRSHRPLSALSADRPGLNCTTMRSRAFASDASQIYRETFNFVIPDRLCCRRGCANFVTRRVGKPRSR